MTEKYDERTEVLIQTVMEEYNIGREEAIAIVEEKWVVTDRMATEVVGVLLLCLDVKWLQGHLKGLEDLSAKRIRQVLGGLHLPGD